MTELLPPQAPHDETAAEPRPVRSWRRLALAGMVGIACIWALVNFGTPIKLPAPGTPPAHAASGETGDPEIGARVHLMKGCVACHTVGGSRNVGPTLAGLFGTMSMQSNGQAVLADEAFFRRAIFEPAAELTAGFPNQMMSYSGKINEQELAHLIAYYKSLPPAAAPPAK